MSVEPFVNPLWSLVDGGGTLFNCVNKTADKYLDVTPCSVVLTILYKDKQIG